MNSWSSGCQRTRQAATTRPRPHHWFRRHVRVRTSSSAAEQQVVKQATLIIGDVEAGQVCDHPGCLVVVGDVDKGATLWADGDILVWGRLEGRVHAGRSSPAGCRVMALELRGAQLKVGEVDSLATAKVTVAGPHTARVQEVGRRRALQLEPATGPALSPDAAVLAASKVRWLRWYPAAGAALFTGLYACLAGGLLLAAPQACFALLFPGTSVPVGWIRVGALLLVTFGAQYLGAAVRDWAAAAASRPRPAPAPAVPRQPAADSSSSRSSSSSGSEWGAAPIPPDAIMEAYSSGSYDEGDALLWAATLPPEYHKQQPAAATAGGVAGPGPGSVVVKTTSAKTLSRGLDATARRQAAQAERGGAVTGLMQKLEDMATSSSSSSSSNSSSSSSNSSEGPTRTSDDTSTTTSTSSTTTSSPGLLPLGLARPAATWLYSSNGFYWATIWSRLLLAGGFTVLVVTGQVGPGLLLLAGMNALGALSMAGALRRQHAHHVLGDAPRQSLLGFLLEGAL